METAFDKLLGLHAEIEHDLDTQLASIASRESEAHRLIAQCFEDRQRIERERAGLKDAERIYRDAFGSNSNAVAAECPPAVPRSPSSPPPPPISMRDSHGSILSDAQTLEQQQVRARIGPQRFLMLDAINTMTHLRVDDIATLTKLSYRRIKDQMVSDVRAGMVSQSNDFYSLTSSGMDLLNRFKAYKRLHGQPLPTADDIHLDDRRDDNQFDDMSSESARRFVAEQKEAAENSSLADYLIADDDGRITDRAT